MTKKATAVLVSALGLLGVSLSVAQAAKDDLVFASRATGPAGAAGDASSTNPSLSADGRYVAFGSGANNLSDADTDVVSDVFVRDLQTNTTVFASRGTGAGPAGAANSGLPSISADGHFVAFESNAANLTAADNDAVRDVFVRHLQTGATLFVSRATDDSAGDGVSDQASISADGRYVAFQSDADNFSTEDNNSYKNIFVRDLVGGTTTYVSRASGVGGTAGDDNSFEPSISADGRSVAFRSDANSLSDEDNDSYSNIFVRDLDTNTTTFVSRASGAGGAAGDNNSYRAAISADGRHVSFDSSATTLDPADTDSTPDIFVRDLQTNTTTYVSRATGLDGEPADADSYDSSVSGDGRSVSFYSLSNNLSAEDDDSYENIFVRDVQAGTTTFVRRASGPTGAPGNGNSTYSSISADGRYVAFDSNATSLSDEDNDAYSDVFVRDVLGTPPGLAPGTPPGPGADTKGPALSGRSLTRGNGVIRVSRRGRFSLFCGRYAEPVTGRCGGRSIRRVVAAQRSRRPLLLGRRSFTAQAGKRTVVRFRLSRRQLRALKREGRIRMRGSATARDALGNATTVSFRFALRAPRRAAPAG
jgi:Tol biopolymer transport system component